MLLQANLERIGYNRWPHVPALERAEVPGGERAHLPLHEQRQCVINSLMEVISVDCKAAEYYLPNDESEIERLGEFRVLEATTPS